MITIACCPRCPGRRTSGQAQKKQIEQSFQLQHEAGRWEPGSPRSVLGYLSHHVMVVISCATVPLRLERSCPYERGRFRWHGKHSQVRVPTLEDPFFYLDQAHPCSFIFLGCCLETAQPSHPPFRAGITSHQAQLQSQISEALLLHRSLAGRNPA